MPTLPGGAAWSGPGVAVAAAAVAGDGVVADGAVAATVGAGCAWSRPRSAGAGAATACSLSCPWGRCVACPRRVSRTGAEDSVAGASSTGPGSWSSPRSGCNSRHRRARRPATAPRASWRWPVAAAGPAGPRNTTPES